MPMVDASYDHIVVNLRDMANFLERFEEILRAALQTARPYNKDFKIFVDPRAQSPLSRNLPSLDVKVFYHAEWRFTKKERADILEYMRPFLEEFSSGMKMKKDALVVRLYRRGGHARISV